MQGKGFAAVKLTSDVLEELSMTSIKSVASTNQSPTITIEDSSVDDSANSRSPSPELAPSPPELALPPIVYHLYILRNGKWVSGYAQGTIMLDNAFPEVKDEFTAKLIDKLDVSFEDSSKFKITFGTKWTVTNTRTTSTAKKPTAPVNPNDFADFKREACLSALIQTIRGTLRTIRGKLDAGNKQLLVLATVADAVGTQVSGKPAENPALDGDRSVIEDDVRQVMHFLLIMLIVDCNEFSTQGFTKLTCTTVVCTPQSSTRTTRQISMPRLFIKRILFHQRGPRYW